MRLRLFKDAALAMTAFGLMTSPTQTAVSVIIMLGILAYLLIESRAVMAELEEWGWDE